MMWLVVLLGACTADPCTESGTVCSVVGTGSAGLVMADMDGGVARESPLYAPMDVAVGDGAHDFFIADWNNHQIRRVTDGEIVTVVGTDFLGDGDPTFEERIPPGVPGRTVALNHPTSMEVNPVNGKLLLPSWHNHRVREVDLETGNSLVVCADTDPTDGNGANAGFAGDGGPAADALMAFPNSITFDPRDGSFWLLPQRNNRIRKVAADYSLIDTVAGTGERAFTGDGGDALDATFHFWAADDLQPEPAGAVEFDLAREVLYVADTSNHAIRVIDTVTNVIETLPGTGTQALPDGACDPEALCFPRDIEVLGDTLFIADEGNHAVRSYDLVNGTMDTLVGTFEPGDSEDGTPGPEASLNRPYGIDVAEDGTVLIADTYNHRIKKVTP